MGVGHERKENGTRVNNVLTILGTLKVLSSVWNLEYQEISLLASNFEKMVVRAFMDLFLCLNCCSLPLLSYDFGQIG